MFQPVAMYVLPKALESAWSSARRRAWVPLVPFGETILGAIAMAMVMDAYKVCSLSTQEARRKLIVFISLQTSACTDRSLKFAAKNHLPVDRSCLIPIEAIGLARHKLSNLYIVLVVQKQSCSNSYPLRPSHPMAWCPRPKRIVLRCDRYVDQLAGPTSPSMAFSTYRIKVHWVSAFADRSPESVLQPKALPSLDSAASDTGFVRAQ